MEGITLEDLFETTDDGILIFSPVYNTERQIVDFRYNHINESALRLIKRTRKELRDNTLLTAFPNLRDSDLFRQYVRVMETGSPHRTEFPYQNEDLNTWFKSNAFRVGTQLMIRFSDVSEYKHMAEESARSEGLYRALIRGLPDVDIVLIDRQFHVRISKGNPLRAYGYSSVITSDSKLIQFLDDETASEITKICRQSFRGKTIRNEISQDGTIYRLSFVPAYDYEGVAFGCLIVTEDIGVFSLSEDELRNKLYALESAKESLEQFAYVASHDLQEPLRKIRAFGDRINSRYADKLDETGRDYFNRMQNAAQRMQKLIDDLLKYSRVGRIQNAFEQINLNVLVAEVLNDLETIIEESKATIEVGDLPTIEGESVQLRQLFQNLLSNAIKFQQPDIPPHISIKAGSIKLEEVDLPAATSNPYEITITDNGIGFNEKYLDRIFSIFQRLHGRNQYPGTGIGLAICRKIVENHQGDIFATSQEGKGSTFHVVLPQQQSLLV